MATYTKLVSSVAAYDFTSTISASTSTSVTFLMDDGTTMVLGGTGFVVSGGQMTAGIITSMTHKNLANVNIETFTGLNNYSAVTFQNFLTPILNTDALEASLFNGADLFYGNTGADTFVGYSGDDQFYGSQGADSYNGGNGSDIVFYRQEGGSGNVFVNLTNAPVTVNALTQAANSATDTFGQTDTFVSIEGAEGSTGNDILIGNSGDNWFRGMEGNDIIQGGAGFDDMTFQPILATGQIPNTGITVTYSGNGDGTVNNDGFGGVDTFTSIERIRGTMLNDVVNGDGSDNFFDGLGGNDTFNAGAGYDTIDFISNSSIVFGSPTGVTVNLATGTATDGLGGTDTFTGVEAVRGTRFVDNLTGSGNTADTEQFRGLAGNDIINGAGGFDEVRYDSDFGQGGTAGVNVNLATGVGIDGFGNTDTLSNIEGIRGTRNADTLTGSGNTADTEQFAGLQGNDIINGGGGFDEVRYDRDANYGGALGVTVNLVAGNAIDGFGNTDTLTNIEAARGTNQNDTFTGNSFDNDFSGLGGADNFTGGGGFDTLRYDRDAANGGGAGITVNYTAAAVGTVVDGFGSTDTFTGFNGIRATALADTINGNAGNESIWGLQGADIINAGAGNNDMVLYDRDAHYGGAAGVVVNLSANAVNVGGLVAAGTARDGFGDTDTLTGVEEARGTAQADTFIGGTGYNFFQGRAGADTYITNVAQYAGSYLGNFGWVDYREDGGAAGINVNLQTGTGTDTYGATESFTNITAIRGSMLGDTITGNQYYNLFQSLGGADNINGGGGYDRVDYSRDSAYGGFLGVTVNLTTGVATDGFGASDTLSNIEEVIGTGGFDNITGNAWDNFLVGGFGNDILAGRDGFDTFRPGQGIDTVDGSVGTNADQGYDDRDQVDYADLGPDLNGLGVIVNLSTASITHETFTVLGNTARDTGGSTDTLIDIERIRGTSGRDYFRGSDTANLREEVFRGMAGNDYIDGGAGFNVVRYQSDTADFGGTGAGGTSGAVVNLSASSITVGANTVIAGTALDAFGNTDTLVNIRGVRGTGLADHVVGGAGYDYFRSYGGADFFDGGAGTRDTVDFYMDDLFFGVTGVGFTIDMVAGTALNFYDNTTTTFVNVEDVNGSERNDSITGNSLGNRLNGDYGNDTINGGAGDDVLSGGTGNDTLDGGANFDIASYLYDPGAGVFNNLQRADWFPTAWGGVTVNLTTGLATDFAGGTDTLVLGTIEGIAGTFFNDNLTGDSADNTFYGLSGNDSIDGAGGNDTVSYANWGNTSGSGAPDLIGINASRPNGVTVTLIAVGAGSANDSEGGTDTLISIENVTGSTGNDTITGSIVNNVLNGGDGNDTLDGGAGADTLIGGNGVDTVTYAAATTVVVAHLDTTVQYGQFGSGASGALETDILSGVENIISGSGDDYLFGDANDNILTSNGGNDSIDAGGGNDTINAGSGADFIIAGHGNDTVNGGDDGDIIYGTAGNDTLNGENGNDTLSGAFGAFTLNGGAGLDLLFADGSAGSTVSGGAGQDYLIIQTTSATNYSAADIENWFGFTGADTMNATGASTLVYMRGNAGNDTLTGGSVGDYLYGDDGDDIINGGDGNDTLVGGAGADTLSGGNGTNVLYVDANDTVIGGTGLDYIVVEDPTNAGITLNIGSSQIDWATGRGGNDTLNAAGAANFVELLGDAGNDTLTAGNGGSILLGGNGLDTLVSGSGTDHMAGGDGADIFAFAANGGTDYVYDFTSGADKIDFTALAGAGVHSLANLTVITTYGSGGWYGYSYGTGTAWVNTFAIGSVQPLATDFLFA